MSAERECQNRFAVFERPLILNGPCKKWGASLMPGNAVIRGILIVEDEASIADTLAVILTTRGYAVQVAYSAEKAIEIIAAWRPDLAIVDVMLPHMNGIDFSIILKDNYPACRIILFSGQPETGALLEEALKKGHTFEILAKPLHPTFVLARVEDLLSTTQEPLTDA
jgi:DNA-binding response OmpR family regulator